MSKNLLPKSIEQLVDEADELIRQINSDVINDMEETHRLKFEKHSQNFKNIKSEVQEEIGGKETSDLSASAEGMHEAILDIVKAFQDLKNKIF